MERYDDRLAYIIIVVITSVAFVGGVKLFIKLTEVLKSEYLANYDRSISEYIQQYRTPALTDYFVFVTNMGDTVGYLIAFTTCTLLFYFFFKSWKYVLQFAMVMVLALSSNLILKQAINRARPDAEHLVTVETLSYPSGHAMMAMAFYGLLIYFVFQFSISKIFRTTLILLLLILILSIGISRIYLGVHFPSELQAASLRIHMGCILYNDFQSDQDFQTRSCDLDRDDYLCC